MPDFITQLDETIIFWVQTHLHNAFTDPFFSIITHLGDAGLIWIVLGVCLLIPPVVPVVGARYYSSGCFRRMYLAI